VVVKEPPKSQWDDEDAEEEEVKQSWEEEDKPKPVPAVAKPKTDKKKAVDIKGAKTSLQDDRLADPLTEKLGQQRLVEESDYQHTTELFGAQKSSGGGLTLDDFIPKSEYDFLEYAELLAQKLRPFEATGEDFNFEEGEGKRPFRALLDVGLVRTTTGNKVFGALK
jgi:translation initiation factor 3 subunit J